MILIALMWALIPLGPDNFKRVIKYQTLNQSQTLHSHLKLILGTDPFKVIRL